MAAARVFAIPELLELILKNANPVQLFALQRVNTASKDVIADSKLIRRRMILEHTKNDMSTAMTLLRDKAVLRALPPFSNFSIYKRTSLSGGSLIIIYLEFECEWFEANRESPPTHLFSKHPRCASWRRICVGKASENAVTLKCPFRTLAKWDGALCEEITLGGVMDLAESAIWQEWDRNEHQFCEHMDGGCDSIYDSMLF
ncbi:hypothetical protein CLAFUW4_10943 [Fulvia fulva]|uniref:F-box domain-containing protein n=1 Tax=Passalora fulva TaxID=5499 RepID=A0A9Q8URD4_PASFU|nr:uncharacterized protein CLAFUR5_09985 [Fulvia fulva]KAK4620223.1 hypothetical protein CLAFUR4_10948 [Fulvia fulva]KAK4620905.1 hypothetical protein CLAFUR0_10955 [Fulvia fulva]UJO19615.1 hypothetical protein CLAFUR5_09985 [Fulvia fulva]WPV17065.1 hypothetical protein CLAFUW4_10943 [Fulvia fulva]WPV31906.1 hypothetical protein CLAFUW7_10941 [Fulvia fulva]